MRLSDGPKLVLGLIALLWSAFVFSSYSIVHKPFVPSQIPALLSLLFTVVAWIATAILAHGLGRILTAWLPELPSTQRIALQIGLGLGILGLGMLALGALGGYWSAIAFAVLVVGLILNSKRFLVDVRSAQPHWPTTPGRQALALFIGSTLVITLVFALAPPTAWDSLVYHLTGPKLYLQAHRLHQDIDLAYLGFPQWGSMLFLWALLLTGPQLAQVLHLTFVLLTLMLLPAVTRQMAPGRAWLAAAVLLAVPSAAMLAGWAYVEWLTMFAGLGAFICLTPKTVSTPRHGPVYIAGLFTGLAFAAKYTAAGLVLGLCILALVRLRSLKSLAIFALGAATIAAPYLLKNWFLTGNPVYPFFMPGKYWDVLRAYWYSRPGTGLTLFQALLAPWDATVWSLEGLVLEGKTSYAATIGPLLLMLVPWVFLGWQQRTQNARQILQALLIVSAVAYVVWAIQLTYSNLLVQSRLLFPALPLVALLAAVGFDALAALNTTQLRVRFVMGGLVAVAFGFTAVDYGLRFLYEAPLPVVIGSQSQHDYLLAHLGTYAVAMDEVNKLPPDARVLFLWEPRSYYCSAANCEPDALLDRWWHLRQLGLDADAIAARWREQDVAYVLINDAGQRAVEEVGFDPFTSQDWAELQSLKSDHLVLVKDLFGAYSLYELK